MGDMSLRAAYKAIRKFDRLDPICEIAAKICLASAIAENSEEVKALLDNERALEAAWDVLPAELQWDMKKDLLPLINAIKNYLLRDTEDEVSPRVVAQDFVYDESQW